MPLKFIQNGFKKANDSDKKILYLLYGSVGILSLEGQRETLFDFLANRAFKESELNRGEYRRYK